MTPNDTALPLSQVHRRDRAIADEAWIEALLIRAPLGTLATTVDGQPFINSNLFVYDAVAHTIYMHTARVGRTRSNVMQHEQVCFSVSEMGRVLPAASAVSFSVEYAGVTVFGRAAIVTDVVEARHALQLLLTKYAPHLQVGHDYTATTDADLARTTVYRIAITEWSGKRNVKPADFPGAFNYGASGWHEVYSAG